MSHNETLTKAQEETLELIKRYINDHGYSPTMGELKEALQLSSIRSVTQRIEALERKGFIARDRFQRRSIRVVGTVSHQYVPSGFIAVPVIASAGCDAMEVYAQDEFGEFIAVDKALVGRATSIAAIKAVGDSMQDAGIHDGDYVIVEVTDKVENGDRICAIIGNMAVIKRLEQQKGFALLHPENVSADYRPIVVKQEDSKIFGKVLSVIPNQEWMDDVKIEYYDGYGPR
jgi:repressor LexA